MVTIAGYYVKEIDGEKKRISKYTGKEVRPYHVKGENLNRDTTHLVQNVLNNIPEETNKKYINHMLAIMEIGKHGDKNDINTLKECFIEYIKLCANTGMKMGNMNAYVAMGITRDDIYAWEHGRTRSRDPEYRAFAVFVKSILAAYRESAMQEGSINPIVGIFWQKAFDGMNEMTEVEASNQSEGINNDQLNAQQIAEKYQDLLPE